MGVGGELHVPVVLTAGIQVQSGRVWKISLSRGFDPWIVQPVASRYTDWAIPAQINTTYYR